jgi:hypothetical protein
MAIYHRKVNGRKVWWARVNHKGLNASRVCDTKDAAKLAESELLQGLKRRAGEVGALRGCPGLRTKADLASSVK